MEEMRFGQTLRDLYTRKVGTDKRNGRQGGGRLGLADLDHMTVSHCKGGWETNF